MLVLVALPESRTDQELASKPVCGIPLMVRALATAAKAGASGFIVLAPSDRDKRLVESIKTHPALEGSQSEIVGVHAFDPANSTHWARIRTLLPPTFAWLPWNAVVSKSRLADLFREDPLPAPVELIGLATNNWRRPMVLQRSVVLSGFTNVPSAGGEASSVHTDSLCVTSSAQFADAERMLLRNSGKETDGLYSRMNRAMCRPAVAVLCRTPITPNAVTALGLLLSMASGYLFAQGTWGAYVLGALCYFACVLCDEMDGMLARLTFSDSAFGCWLETVADYVSYLFLFAGLTVGLFREYGIAWLWVGLLMIAGSVTVMLVLSYQRKKITDPDRPQDFRKRLQTTLEKDISHPVSWLGRNLEFMIRKPAYCYWVLLFCVLGQAKALVFLTAFGANAAWMMALSYNRLFKAGSVMELKGQTT